MSESNPVFIQTINEMFPDPMLTDVQIADILGIHRQTVYRMRKNGTGPAFIKIGKKVLCIKDDFFEWFFSRYSKNNY